MTAPTDAELDQMFADSLDSTGAPVDGTSEAPEYSQPDGATPGNVPPPPPAEPTLHNYSYTRDVADTALVWAPGAPLDVGAIRQYLVDRGYVCTAVQAQVDDAGQPTGVVTIWTDAIPPSLDVAITGGDETSAVDGTTPVTYIADTAIVTIPTDYTYSGDVTFAAEMLRDANDDPLPLVPVINGTNQTAVEGDWQDIGYTTISATISVTGQAGGTTPSFGLAFGGANTGDTLSIRNGTITGQLTPDGSAVAEISTGDWAAYDGSRYTGLQATVVVWTDTAEGAIVAKPDLPRIGALWLYLEAHSVEVAQMTGPWNFATPDTAPVSPEITVFARGAISSTLTDAFLFAQIDPAALDAFTVDWNPATSTSTMTRKVSSQVETPGQDDRSAPYIFFQDTEPTGDVRDQDIWWPNTPLVRKIRLNGEWAPLPTGFTLTNESSTSVGRNANATTVRATAVGAGADATGLEATAIGAETEGTGNQSVSLGTRAKGQGIQAIAIGDESRASGSQSWAMGYTAVVPDTSPRSFALGTQVTIPASTPDTGYIKINGIRVFRSIGTGETYIEISSADGTFGKITVTNDDKVLVNGVAQNVPASGSITSAMILDGTIVDGDVNGNFLDSRIKQFRVAIPNASTASTSSLFTAYDDTVLTLPSGTWAGWVLFESDFTRTVNTGQVTVTASITGQGSLSKNTDYIGGSPTVNRRMVIASITGAVACKFEYRGGVTAGTTNNWGGSITGMFWRIA